MGAVPVASVHPTCVNAEMVEVELFGGVVITGTVGPAAPIASGASVNDEAMRKRAINDMTLFMIFG